MSETCQRRGLFGRPCRFFARYDTVAPTPEQINAVSGPLHLPVFWDQLKRLTGRIYRGEACARCGRVTAPSPEGSDE